MTKPPSDSRDHAGHANRLADEASAYLQQHSGNPVDWYPWGEEALAHARAEDKPLFVSIGYSSCHWCHVMERESFEDAETAALLNAEFVSIKVDREERPDIDQIYMDTVVRLTGQGGWPLSIFCKPDGSPFYGGTYFPPETRPGMPSFKQVLMSIADAYRERRSEIDHAAEQIIAALAAEPEGDASARPGREELLRAARLIMRGADLTNGGFGGAPKFPTPTNLELLLAAIDFLPQTEAQAVARHVSHTCREMSRRGLFDHLGGGFHRYCVDSAWTIPHFEKMLYDQGLLLRVYAELWRRGGEPDEQLWPIRETATFLRREMTSPEGGFYASQDADAEGVEGAYHVWTPEQIEAELGERGAAFCQAYGVDRTGNFEHGTTHLVDQAREPRSRFAAERAALLAARVKRVAPETDRKRVAAWNGYAISGLARAGSLLDESELLTDATRAMDFVLDELVDSSGRLYRVFNRGTASVPAFLDDHASLLDACLDLHRAGAGDTYLTAALHFATEIGERFFEEASGRLYFTPSDGETLVHRPRSDHDGATPSAVGLASLGLVRLAQLSGLARIGEWAERIVASHAPELERTPHAQPTLLRAVGLMARGVSVAVIIGEPTLAETAALALRARRILCPEDAVVVAAPGTEAPAGVSPEWLRDRTARNGLPTAYVCRGTTCTLPVHRPEELRPLEAAN